MAGVAVHDVLQQWQALFWALPRKALGLAGWLIALGLLFGVLERWRPILRRRFARQNLGQDVAYFFIGGLLPPFFTVLVAAAVVGFASGLVPADFYVWVGGWPLWLRVVAMVVLGDLAFYWAHRWSHEVGCLWRLHAVHHSPTGLDWLVNTRAHPLDLVFARVVSSLPMLVLGLRQPTTDMHTAIAIVLTVTTVWAFFVHANLDWRLGWLEHIVVTPAFHHWHHANDAPSSLNKNYAALLPWLDRLFGTHHLPADRFPASYGANLPVQPNPSSLPSGHPFPAFHPPLQEPPCPHRSP